MVRAGLSWSLRSLVRKSNKMDSTSDWFLYAKGDEVRVNFKVLKSSISDRLDRH